MGDWSDADLVEAMCEIDEGLNEWEVTFVESAARRFEQTGSLTDPQRTVAHKIVERFDD